MTDRRYAYGRLTAQIAPEAKCDSFTLSYELNDGQFKAGPFTRVVRKGEIFRANGFDEKGQPINDDINDVDWNYRPAIQAGPPAICPAYCCQEQARCRWRCGTKYSAWTDQHGFGPLVAVGSTVDIVLTGDVDAQGRCQFAVTTSDQTDCLPCYRSDPRCPHDVLASEEKQPVLKCRNCPPRPPPAPQKAEGSIPWFWIIVGAVLFGFGVLFLLWGLLRR